MVWSFLLAGLLIGVVAEVAARGLRLWLFRRPWLAVLNVVLVYGVIMGGLASLVRPVGAVVIFAAAFLVGLAYELANLQFLHFWSFPDQRGDASGARAAMVIILSVLWGAVPLIAAEAEGTLRHANVFGPPPDPMVVLEGREHDLLEKQASLRQRLHDVEERLDAVHKRQENLRHKQQRHAAPKAGAAAEARDEEKP